MESEIEKISPFWLITAFIFIPVGVYQLLNLLSPFVNNLTAMTISEIYVYPIKSLRGVKLTEAVGTKYGFKHDRTFMLLEVTPTGHKNMAVSRYPAMTQFLTEITGHNTTSGTITITYRAYGDAQKAKTLTIPLTPNTEKLPPFDVKLHESKVTALKMPDEHNAWFSSCFGFDVVLVYLGANKRAVLFQDMQPRDPTPLSLFIHKYIPLASPYLTRLTGGPPQTAQHSITFADCAPYLITSQTSLADISSRLPPGSEMQMSKFRPNIVLSGAFEPYEEDYWGSIRINHAVEMVMAHNCPRCQSINIDYETGKQGTGPEGQVLKRMQHDRRIDAGSKWSPVFGRYGFWDARGRDVVVRVGYRVNVTKVNPRLTVWSWDNVE
ncbi:hypothetical protein P153DRAFT_380140 [Dothidotthia symphoricarpi CBS 119687]|uniref:MOSC domain-containing protein n=1 Tax=Dothidotthia symphoricarpi CBS 119687 TaxID=1392245 RepID=A0A6A5ZV68_9PLEO|nr:uncharacterized protein P153DRAFT_380140 [Dothidotthia symphoricarpi CBS 119687]KAF2123399.1 hypothetical protein P153DRAFT_380140 [Dothidotthia symphoricarpi CBS 119687]